MSIAKKLIRLPVIGRVILMLYRLQVAARYFAHPLKHLIIWVLRSRETTNFTYDLEEINKCYLTAFIATILSKPYEEIAGYIREVESDEVLRKHIQATTATSQQRLITDLDVQYGKRLGWYAFARATKPGLIVETGVDKGLGSCVLTAALMRNAEEGHIGYYYGTDLSPKAGFLLAGDYARFGKILYGDSIESLEAIEGIIDLFINDSDHSPEYEAREYRAITSKINDNTLILGDNAHVTNELFKFANTTGRQFLMFYEKPARHWYPGGGIGVAFKLVRNQ